MNCRKHHQPSITDYLRDVSIICTHQKITDKKQSVYGYEKLVENGHLHLKNGKVSKCSRVSAYTGLGFLLIEDAGALDTSCGRPGKAVPGLEK